MSKFFEDADRCCERFQLTIEMHGDELPDLLQFLNDIKRAIKNGKMDGQQKYCSGHYAFELKDSEPEESE